MEGLETAEEFFEKVGSYGGAVSRSATDIVDGPSFAEDGCAAGGDGIDSDGLVG
jgi:hypothetical protein